jgi:rhamnogalacturonan endolyase
MIPANRTCIQDGIVYNYISSNHHGNQVPDITNGFDRTFGPSYFYLNKGPAGTSLEALRSDAAKYANPSFAASFYDDIAHEIPGYIPTSGRGSWQAKLNLPKGASNAIAILSQDRVNYQDNLDTKAYQYWADIDDHNGKVSIDRVKAGTYRLTVHAAGVFGFYEQDGIVIGAGQNTDSKNIKWDGESAGTELWRIGTPDLSSGEFRHGDARDPTHPLQPPEYRIYWGQYDFINDFPEGVNFVVGKSNEATDWNYVHWSVFGGYANYRRPKQVEGNGEINNWTITFDLNDKDLRRKSTASFTIQLAGAKTAAGNTDLFNSSEPYSNLPLAVVVNGHELDPWIIP